MTDWTDAKPWFETTALGHVATLLADGSPHSTPVWVGIEGDHLTFFTEAGSMKDRNLQRDPRIAVSVTKPDNPLSMAFVRGLAARRLAGDDALPIVDRIAMAYTGAPYDIRQGMVAWLIEPHRAWANAYEE